MKSVSIIYYSLTDQCQKAAEAIARALSSSCTVHLIRVKPAESRWKLQVPFKPMWGTFFGTLLPVLQRAKIEVEADPETWPEADAVVIGGPTWWNSLSPPMLNLLRSEKLKSYIKGKPVALFAGCRGLYKNNLEQMRRIASAAGARVVAQEKFTFTGSLLGTFGSFFSFLKFGEARKRWLGISLPPYGFSQKTLEAATNLAELLVRSSSEPPAPSVRVYPLLESAVRYFFLALTLFDLGLAVAFIFFGKLTVGLFASADYAQPLFFQRCVGLFLLQYVYIQFMAYRNPSAHATCLNMTVLIRVTFPVIYLSQVALWGTPMTALHWLFIGSALGDLLSAAFILYAMKKLRISFFQGDEIPQPDAESSWFLRLFLLVLAIAEFSIAWNWLLAPYFWCGLFDVPITVDPFWTRGTGVFLLNIAYIQFLGFVDPHKYRSAALTSGVFRALWPLLYWYTTASREGNELFRFSIMFFSFFDLISGSVIFWLLYKIKPREKPVTQKT